MRRSRTIRRGVGASLIASTLVLAGCSGIQGSGVQESGSPEEGGSGETLSLQFNSFLGATTPQAAAMQEAFAAIEEESDGSVQIEEFWSGALVNGPDTLAAVAEGRVGLGHMTVLYNPAELPLSQVIAIPFVTDDVSNVAAIYHNLYETNDAYRAEWESRGVVPIYFLGVPTSAVGGKTEITGPEWFAGKNIRSTGYLANAVQLLGGNPVALQSPEVYEALQRGTVDGWTNNILDTAIGDQSLHEQTPWVTDAGTGLYTVNAVIVSTSTWEGFTEEQQELFRAQVETLNTTALEELQVKDDAACDALIGAGGGATVWTDDQVGEWSDLVGTSALDSWKNDVRNAGGDPDSFFEEYSAQIEDAADPDFVNGIERCAERTESQ